MAVIHIQLILEKKLSAKLILIKAGVFLNHISNIRMESLNPKKSGLLDVALIRGDWISLHICMQLSSSTLDWSMSTLSKVKGQTNYKLFTFISTLKHKISFISTVKMRISLQVIYFFITLGLGSPIPDPDTINIIFNCVSSNCNQVNGHPGTDVGGVTHPKGSSETEKFRGV